MSTHSGKRVPPPCWSVDETVALINAYGSRWLSLNRGNLRTSDWESVSSAVSESTPGSSKSSIQCRHKIEKLRKRYRSEKQRSVSFPGRFVSSWDLFPLLDSMNFGSSSAAAGFSNQSREVVDQKLVDVAEFRAKFRIDKSLTTQFGNIDAALDPGFALRSGSMRNYGGNDFDDDFGALGSRADDYFNVNGDFGVGFGVKREDCRNFVTPHGFRVKSCNKIEDEKLHRRLDFNHHVDGFPVRTFGDRIPVPAAGLKPKNLVKVNPDPYYDSADYVVAKRNGSEFYAKTLDEGDMVPVGIRSKNYGRARADGNLNGNVDLRGMNVYDASSRLKSDKRNGDGGVKRDFDPFEELVSSITMLTEKFVKMEKMKLEMVRETQKMRMEMEMKQNQMILESQEHILNTFLSGLLEKQSKKKVKVRVMSPNTNGNRGEV